MSAPIGDVTTPPIDARVSSSPTVVGIHTTGSWSSRYVAYALSVAVVRSEATMSEVACGSA